MRRPVSCFGRCLHTRQYRIVRYGKQTNTHFARATEFFPLCCRVSSRVLGKSDGRRHIAVFWACCREGTGGQANAGKAGPTNHLQCRKLHKTEKKNHATFGGRQAAKNNHGQPTLVTPVQPTNDDLPLYASPAFFPSRVLFGQRTEDTLCLAVARFG